MPQFPKRKLTPEEDAQLAALDPLPPLPAAVPPQEAEASAADPKQWIPKQYRVTRACRGSWYGQMVSFTEGQVLDESGYGPDGIERLRESGVALEEVRT